MNDFFLLFSASSVICLGQEFRPGRMVCILKPSDTEYPAVFGEIQHVIIVEDLKYLAAQHISLTTTSLLQSVLN